MTILRKQSDIPGAAMADLVETYNAMSAKPVKKFVDRGTAEARVANAMLSAANADGATGIPKGSKPQPKTTAELADKVASKGLRATLAEKAGDAPPNPPRAKSQPKGEASERSPKVARVEPTGEGRSKMRDDSARNIVFMAIVAAHKANRKKPVDLDAFAEAQPELATGLRGHVLKLIYEGHLRAAA